MRTLRGELIEKGIVGIGHERAPKCNEKKSDNNTHKKQKERLTTREIEELMGVYRPRYEKRNGAVRQK